MQLLQYCAYCLICAWPFGWQMPNSSAWTNWGIDRVAVALHISHADQSEAFCVRNKTWFWLPNVKTGINYSIELALVAATQCADGKGGLGYNLTLSVVGHTTPSRSTTHPVNDGRYGWFEWQGQCMSILKEDIHLFASSFGKISFKRCSLYILLGCVSFLLVVFTCRQLNVWEIIQQVKQ